MIRKTLEPQWEAEWIVANCPQQGFEVKARLFDEDPSVRTILEACVFIFNKIVQSGDDSLGSAHIWLGPLHATYHLDHHPVEVRRRSGSWRAYGAQRLRNSISRDKQDIRATLVVSVQVLGRTEAKSGAKAYTVGPSLSFKLK